MGDPHRQREQAPDQAYDSRRADVAGQPTGPAPLADAQPALLQSMELNGQSEGDVFEQPFPPTEGDAARAQSDELRASEREGEMGGEHVVDESRSKEPSDQIDEAPGTAAGTQPSTAEGPVAASVSEFGGGDGITGAAASLSDGTSEAGGGEHGKPEGSGSAGADNSGGVAVGGEGSGGTSTAKPDVDSGTEPASMAGLDPARDATDTPIARQPGKAPDEVESGQGGDASSPDETPTGAEADVSVGARQEEASTEVDGSPQATEEPSAPAPGSESGAAAGQSGVSAVKGASGASGGAHDVMMPASRSSAEGGGADALLAEKAPVFRAPDVEALLPVVDGEPPEAREQRLAVARRLVEEDRTFATSATTRTFAAWAPMVDGLVTDGDVAVEQIEGGRLRADAAVDAALQEQSAAVQAAAASERALVSASAASSRARIEADRIRCLAELDVSIQAARTQVQTGFEAARQTVQTRAAAQRAEVEALYDRASADFAAAGQEAAQAAQATGARRAAHYRSQRINREDSLTDGYLTDNRCEARAEAAEKVAEFYREGLLTEAERIADEARLRLGDDLLAVDALADEALAELEAAEAAQIQALDALQTRSAGELESTGVAMLAQVDADEAGHLQRISAGAVSGRQSLASQRRTIGQALTQQAQQASRDIRSGIDILGARLGEALGPMDGAVDLPPAETLGPALDEATAATRAQVESAKAGLRGVADASLAALAEAGVNGAAALTRTGGEAAAGLSASGRAGSVSLAAIGESAAAAFTDVLARANQGAAGIAEEANRTITATEERMQAAFDALARGLHEGFEQNVGAVRGGMMDVVISEMPGVITEEANAAAAQVQPRWKSVLKWVIIIAIAVVVAVVLGPMIISAVSGLAAGLGASATAAGIWGAVAGGAIAGTLASGATTVVANLFDGRDWHAGLLKSMAIGALGGAVGGGLGLGIGRLSEARHLSNLSQFGISVGSDVALDIGFSAAMGDLSWESFGVSVLMSVLTTGAASTPLGKSLQTRMMGIGYGSGYQFGQGVHGAATGQNYQGAAPTIESQHINYGDDKSGTNQWNMKGGGHNPDNMGLRAQQAGYGEATLATDPLTGATIKEYSRPKLDNQGQPIVDPVTGQPQVKTISKSQFPAGMSDSTTDALATKALTDALAGRPHSSLTPPAGTGNGEFRALVTSPDGHPMPVKGYYSVDANGIPHIETAFPESNIMARQFSTDHVPGSYGTRPLYATPPHGATTAGEDEESP